MSTVKLRIAANGSVAGLWSDAVAWRAIGRIDVRRASLVEFSRRRQMWFVRAERPRSALRTNLQAVFRQPIGEILYWANSRADALACAAAYFGVGGP